MQELEYIADMIREYGLYILFGLVALIIYAVVRYYTT